MDNSIIYKVQWKTPLAGKLLQLHSKFIPHLYRLFGVDMYIEMVMDGAIIFYKSMSDFVKFHKVAEFVSLSDNYTSSHPEHTQNETIELTVEKIKAPPDVSSDEFFQSTAKCYQIVSKDIEIERISESKSIIKYKDAKTFEAVFDALQELWKKSSKSGQAIPKSEEIANNFANLPFQ